jgi:hypothetical protein
MGDVMVAGVGGIRLRGKLKAEGEIPFGRGKSSTNGI